MERNSSYFSFEFLKEYINNNFIMSNDKNTIVSQFIQLDNLFHNNNYIPEIECFIGLIKNCSVFENNINFLFNKYKKDITKEVFDTAFKSDSLVLAIDAYCILNNIDKNIDFSSYDISNAINNSLRFYFLEVDKIPMLDPSKEKEVALKAKNGDKEYCDLLVTSNLRLVIHEAIKYRNRGLSLLDLIQEGNIGLMNAVNKFDVSQGCKFSTYAIPSIKRHIIRAIHNKGKSIRIPVNMHRVIYDYKCCVLNLTEKLGRTPTSLEVSEELSIPVSTVDLLWKSTYDVISINSLIFPDEESEFQDFVADNSEELYDDEICIDSSFSYDNLFSCLSVRERKIVELRYGVGGKPPMTLDAIGEKFGIGKERVRQILLASLDKIRMSKSIEEFEGYMPNPDLSHRFLEDYRKKNKFKKRKYY